MSRGLGDVYKRQSLNQSQPHTDGPISRWGLTNQPLAGFPQQAKECVIQESSDWPRPCFWVSIGYVLVGDSSRGNSPECGVIQFERRARKREEVAAQILQPFKVGGWKARDGKLLDVSPKQRSFKRESHIGETQVIKSGVQL